jgi:hypothetical protein
VRTVALSAILVGVFLLGVQVALAATPNDVQYNSTTTEQTTTQQTTTQQTTQQTTTRPAAPHQTTTGQVAGKQTQPRVKAAKSSGTLPFTGLDLGFIFAGAALVVAGGFGLRRLSRSRAE